MRSVLLLCVGCLVVGVSSANTLSEAYDQAFANPKGFDWYVLERVDEAFYGKIAACAPVAIRTLTGIENISRHEYSACTENSECVAIAKEIGVIVEAKENVRGLASYFEGRRRADGPDFLESEVGRQALGGFEILERTTGLIDEQATALIRDTPAFQGVLDVLGKLPCQ